MSLVLDASVVAKWFFPEIHQANALRVLSLKQKLVAPDLLWPEFGNVVWKKLLRRETTLLDASECIDRFMICAIECHPTQSLLTAAFAFSKFTGIGVYDAFYLALAEREKGSLVSADRKMCAAAKKSNVSHIWVGDLS